ncbi:7881_t:CDS:2, partial [Ambispora gerdemannii]
TRRTFDRALEALPITQHPKRWNLRVKLWRNCNSIVSAIPKGKKLKLLRIFHSSSWNQTMLKDALIFLLSLNRYDEARDVFEEDIATVIKVRDFTQIFYAYAEFEETNGKEDPEEDSDLELRLSTNAVYERILELKIATPQIIINYAKFLEANKYFEESFKVYERERGVELFNYPIAFEFGIYLTKFIN